MIGEIGKNVYLVVVIAGEYVGKNRPTKAITFDQKLLSSLIKVNLNKPEK